MPWYSWGESEAELLEKLEKALEEENKSFGPFVMDLGLVVADIEKAILDVSDVDQVNIIHQELGNIMHTLALFTEFFAKEVPSRHNLKTLQDIHALLNTDPIAFKNTYPALAGLGHAVNAHFQDKQSMDAIFVHIKKLMELLSGFKNLKLDRASERVASLITTKLSVVNEVSLANAVVEDGPVASEVYVQSEIYWTSWIVTTFSQVVVDGTQVVVDGAKVAVDLTASAIDVAVNVLPNWPSQGEIVPLTPDEAAAENKRAHAEAAEAERKRLQAEHEAQLAKEAQERETARIAEEQRQAKLFLEAKERFVRDTVGTLPGSFASDATMSHKDLAAQYRKEIMKLSSDHFDLFRNDVLNDYIKLKKIKLECESYQKHLIKMNGGDTDFASHLDDKTGRITINDKYLANKTLLECIDDPNLKASAKLKELHDRLQPNKRAYQVLTSHRDPVGVLLVKGILAVMTAGMSLLLNKAVGGKCRFWQSHSQARVNNINKVLGTTEHAAKKRRDSNALGKRPRART